MAHCPTPWKATYPDPGSAGTELDNLKRSRKGRFAAFQAVYQCGCGSWHIGDRRKKPRRKKPRGSW